MHLSQVLLAWYFETLDKLGLMGVAATMAIWIPGEFIIPPATYLLVYKGHHSLLITILLTLRVALVGAIGYTASVCILYWIARGLGRPLIVKYGKYLFIPEKKLKLAERLVEQYGAGGIVLGTFVPGIRHFLAIPAGLMGMRFRTYTLMTSIGAFAWCTVLAVIGLFMSHDMEQLVQTTNTAAYEHALSKLTWAMTAFVLIVGLIYFVTLARKKKSAPTQLPIPAPRSEV